MKTMSLFATVLLLCCLTITCIAQSFSLHSFNAGRQQLMKDLNLDAKKQMEFEKVYSQLNKELLKMNDEIIGKSKEQITSLIEGKFKSADSSFYKLIGPKEMKAVQKLNDTQKGILTNGLVGKNGIMQANGLLDAQGRAVKPVRKRFAVITE